MSTKSTKPTRRRSKKPAGRPTKPVPYAFGIGTNELNTQEARDAKKLIEYRRVTVDAGTGFNGKVVRVTRIAKNEPRRIVFLSQTKTTSEWRKEGAMVIKTSFGGNPEAMVAPSSAPKLMELSGHGFIAYVRERGATIDHVTIHVQGNDAEFLAATNAYFAKRYAQHVNSKCEGANDSCQFVTDPARLYRTLLAICDEVDAM